MAKSKREKEPVAEPEVPKSVIFKKKKKKKNNGEKKPAPEPAEDAPPKIVLKNEHMLVDRKAKTKVRCKATINLRTAGGAMVQLRAGKDVMVPTISVEDLRRSKLIY